MKKLPIFIAFAIFWYHSKFENRDKNFVPQFILSILEHKMFLLSIQAVLQASFSFWYWKFWYWKFWYSPFAIMWIRWFWNLLARSMCYEARFWKYTIVWNMSNQIAYHQGQLYTLDQELLKTFKFFHSTLLACGVQTNGRPTQTH